MLWVRTAGYSAAHSQAEVGVVLDNEVLHELVVLGDVRERREEVAVAQRALRRTPTSSVESL